MVGTSLVVIAVREGNPEGIRDWPDLARPGLNVLTPDPKTSGGAQWNINAIYGAALRGQAGVAKDDPAAAREFLKSVFRNVSIMDKGARESITNYEKGVGDVAVTYENEVLVGRQGGQRYEYVIPRPTILIENPVAVIDRNVDARGTREVAEAFVESKRPGAVEWALIAAVALYAAVLLVGPFAAVIWGAFSEGFGAFVEGATSPEAPSALKLTLLLAVGATVINTVFGVCIAWVLVRDPFRGRGFLNALVDLPFVVSPVIAGLMLILLFGRDGWLTPPPRARSASSARCSSSRAA